MNTDTLQSNDNKDHKDQKDQKDENIERYKKSWNKLHLQIIYYGREYCKARECFGISCKICTTCYPNRIKPIKTKKA